MLQLIQSEAGSGCAAERRLVHPGAAPSLMVEFYLSIGRAGLSRGSATLHDRSIPNRSFPQVNASTSQSQIATQPEPSAAVAKFLKRPPRLFIGGEWVVAESQGRISAGAPATGRELSPSVHA